MGKLKDMTGLTFGKLTVLKRAENAKDGHVQWLCKCECGNEIVCKGSLLRQNQIKSCGCIIKENLEGKKFGRLLVLKYAYSKEGRRYWECKCDCGNITYVSTHSLTTGNTKSCGCLRSELATNFNIKEKSKIDQNNIIGKTFDFLTVLKQDTSQIHNTYYICRCSNCGNIKSIRYSDLISGRVHACGCLNSWGEAQLRLLLDKYKIQYQTQYIFEDLKSDKNYPLRFDFGILNNGKLLGLIEYQGEQHTRESSTWHTESLIKYDKKKKEYCINHNIPLAYCDINTNLETFIKEVVFQWLSLEFST